MFVEFVDCSASLRTSSATIEKPLPCSPALAASIDAFKANKLVCSAIEFITSTIVLISFELSFISNIVSLLSLL